MCRAIFRRHRRQRELAPDLETVDAQHVFVGAGIGAIVECADTRRCPGAGLAKLR